MLLLTTPRRPGNLWPLPGPRRKLRKTESTGGQRRSESKGAVTMDLQAAVIRNAGAGYPGSRDPDRGGGRKVFIGIAGRKAPDPKPGRKVWWKGGPKGQVPDTGSRDLRLGNRPCREAGIGCRVARPSPKGDAARWVSGAAGGQDTQVVWKVGASRTAGMVMASETKRVAEPAQ